MTRKALIAAIQQFIFNKVWILNVSEDYLTIPYFQKALKRFLKVTDCTEQLQVRQKVVGFGKALGAVNKFNRGLRACSTWPVATLAP